MYEIIIAGLGGFIGTVCRYLLNTVIYRVLDYPLFPYGILTINMLGCFLIGLFAGLMETRLFSPELKVFVQIGLLGGFTTFSTFGYETFALLRDGQYILSVANVLLQVFFGLLAVWLGYNLTQ